MLKQRHQFFVSMLVVADAVVIALASLAAWTIRRELIEHDIPAIHTAWDLRQYLREPLIMLTVPIGLASLWGLGLYRPRRDRSLGVEQWQIVKAGVLTIVALIVALWVVGRQGLGVWSPDASRVIAGIPVDAARLQTGSLAVLIPLLLGAERMGFRLMLRTLRRRGWNQRHVAIIGTGRLGRIVCRTLDRNSWTGINVAYFVSHHDVNTRTECCGRPIRGGLGTLEATLEAHPPDAVYIAIPTAQTAVRPDLLRSLERFALDVRLVPDVLPRYTPDRMVLSELDGMPILSLRESPLLGIGGAAKRVLDVVGALAGLAVFGVPMILIAVLVRLTSPGPVIFRQRRVSLGGEAFTILKFRTMYDADDERSPARWTTRDDPRITPVGRWLRRMSLDELPQLFNVLVGDMSLVGPRPERPELIARFRDDWRGYMMRQHVKAGITGWAQVNGLRGDTSLRKRLQLDLFYVRNWSLGFDVKILLLTLLRGFVHRNAH